MDPLKFQHLTFLAISSPKRLLIGKGNNQHLHGVRILNTYRYHRGFASSDFLQLLPIQQKFTSLFQHFMGGPMGHGKPETVSNSSIWGGQHPKGLSQKIVVVPSLCGTTIGCMLVMILGESNSLRLLSLSSSRIIKRDKIFIYIYILSIFIYSWFFKLTQTYPRGSFKCLLTNLIHPCD